MRKFEFENQNLQYERDIFVSKINKLEQSNQSQEKMINYLQAASSVH